MRSKPDDQEVLAELSLATFFEQMSSGVASCRMLYQDGQPDDFMYLYTNPAFHRQTGLGLVVGKRVSEVVPGIRESDPALLAIYGRVSAGGAPERFEFHVEALQHWFSVQVSSQRAGHFLAVFDVITSYKQAELSSKEAAAFKKVILNSVEAEIVVLDNAGVIVAVNEPWRRFAMENQNDPDRPVDLATGIGTNYLDVCHAGEGTDTAEINVAGDGIKAVLQGRMPVFSLNYPCHSPGLTRWFRMVVLPFGEEANAGVVITHTEITDRILREQEKASALSLLQKVASRVPGLIYQYRLRPDGSSCFPFASDAIREIYRVNPEDVRDDATRVFANLHPDDYDNVVASIRKSAQDLTAWQHEYRVKFNDGTVRWLFGNALPEREKDGSILWYGFITDVTDRVRSAEKISALMREQKAMLNNDIIGIVTVKDRTILWANPAFEQMLGYAPGELASAPTRQCHSSAEAYEEFGAAAYPVILAGNVYSAQMEQVRKDGRHIWVRVSGSMADPESGQSLWGFVDITALVQSEAKLRESQRVAQLGHWEIDLGANTLIWSDEMFHIYGVSTTGAAPTPENFLATVHHEDREHSRSMFDNSMRSHSRLDLTHRVLAPDDELKYVHVLGATLYAQDGTPLRSSGTAQNVTHAMLQEQALKESEERFRTIADYTYDWEYWENQAGQILYVSPACERVSGYSQFAFYSDSSLLGRIVHPDDALIYAEHKLECGLTADASATFRIIRKDGAIRWLAHGCSPVFSKDGNALGRRASNRDITDLKNAEQLANQLAYFDSLTNLPNRRMLLDRLDQGLMQAKRFRRSLAVMFLDLDNFKEVNDRFGHNVGDELLKVVAGRLDSCVRAGDTVARSGGDEFIIVLPEIANATDATLVAEKIIETFRTPVQVNALLLDVTTSIGIAVYPIDGTDDAQTLMKMADTAMYAIKNSGRNGYRLFVPDELPVR